MNVFDLPAHTPTRLITSPTDVRAPINYRTTDASSALTRALAEYVASLSFTTDRGRQLRFVASFDAWAEPENDSVYPSFVAHTNGSEGVYEAASISPHVSTTRYADGTYETSASELAIDVKCEIWANDTEERKALILMLEDGFGPVDWMEGLRLECPHYFNQRATFSLVRVQYDSNPADNIARFVKAFLTVRGNIPVTRVLGFPQAKPVVRVTAATTTLPAAGAGVDVNGLVP